MLITQIRDDVCSCKTHRIFLMKRLEKFQEIQSDTVPAKMFQETFYFYLCCLWNEYCIVGSVDFISDTISSCPQSLPRCQKQSVHYKRLPSLNRRKESGGWQNESWWAFSPLLKLCEFILVLANMISRRRVTKGQIFRCRKGMLHYVCQAYMVHCRLGTHFPSLNSRLHFCIFSREVLYKPAWSGHISTVNINRGRESNVISIAFLEGLEWRAERKSCEGNKSGEHTHVGFETGSANCFLGQVSLRAKLRLPHSWETELWRPRQWLWAVH